MTAEITALQSSFLGALPPRDRLMSDAIRLDIPAGRHQFGALLSDGTRSIAEIARIVGFELGHIEPALVAEMCGDLAELGYVVLDDRR